MNKILSYLFRLIKKNNNFLILNEIEDAKILNGKILSKLNDINTTNNIEDFEFKVFSQFGEDGIIDYLVKKTDIKNDEKFFIEIGVGDYSECNTKFLLMNSYWSGIAVEGNNQSVEKIKKKELFWKYNLDVINEWVRKDNIKRILSNKIIDQKLGLLSLDIDGNDYWILHELEILKPIILIVEWNSLFGPDKNVTVPYDDNFVREKKHFSGQYWGASIRAFYNLMQKRNYSLICSNKAGNNLFFVRNDRLKNLKTKKPDEVYINQIFNDSKDKNGKLNFLDKNKKLENLENLDLIDLENNQIIKISELTKKNKKLKTDE